MEDIKDVCVTDPMPPSQFIKPIRLNYTQNGNKRIWDLVKTYNSVACLLFNTSRKVLLFVTQFRPAVYYNGAMTDTGDNSIQSIDWTKVSPKTGMTIELCAGIVDANKPPNEIMKKEVIEECGYDVPLENFSLMKRFRSGIGFSGDSQTLFYAECTDEMKISKGGGNADEGELIEVVEMTIPEVREYLSREVVLSPAGLLYAVSWFLANKAPKD